MKKKLLLIPIFIIILIAGCKKSEADKEPLIEGIASIECVVNTKVDLLNGVIAYDPEDGDITASMQMSIFPFVSVKDGYAVFEQAGNYKVVYEVADAVGHKATKSADIAVASREVFLSFSSANGFYITASGHATLNKSGLYNGQYIIEAVGCEIAEDVCLNRIYQLESDYLYTFKYFLNTTTSGHIRILVNGNYIDNRYLEVGDNIIEFNYDSTLGSIATISLQLGELGDAVTCQFNGVELERPQEAGLVEQLESFTVTGRFDGTQGNAFALPDIQGGKLEITASSNDNWRGGMFLNTNINVEPGKEYVVSFDIERKNLLPCEITLQNRQWDEKKFDTILVDATEEKTHHQVTIVPTEDTRGALWLYVQSGLHVNDIVLSNLSVKTYLGTVKKETLSLTDFTNFNDGFNCQFNTFAGGFQYTIETFAEHDYQQKVTSPEFFISGSGKNYVISFKAKASSPTEVVFAGPIAGGWDPTWVWSKFTITEEEEVYTFWGNDDGSERSNVLVWQFGSIANQKNTNVTIEISDIKISYRNTEYDGE